MARILAASSGGGHLEQLILIAPAFAGHDWQIATTNPAQARMHGISDPLPLPDCNLHQPVNSLRCALAALSLVRKLRPDVVISTGAAPGFFCILWGRLFGARTLWVDSVANAERLSLSGRLARHVADHCLTQWEHLADGNKLYYSVSPVSANGTDLRL